VDGELKGRAAFVTGGATGLGRAIALRLAEAGADVGILSLNQDKRPAVADEVKHFASGGELAEARQAVEAAGVRCLALEGDAANAADVERAVALTVQAFGRLDILVNNAATNVVHPVLDHDPASWERVIRVNLLGPFLCARFALPHLIANGWGRIISIGSTNAHVGTAFYSAYAASKHGLLGFSRSLALEVAPHNITANTISPGFIETPSAQLHIRWFANHEGVSYEEMRQRYMDSYPQKRFIPPEEIAALVLYLCRDDARAINGEDIAITTGAGW
jgi:NAD(P)-dependent dehydrogenase (short-subunit alcohol dehydrogenase family)